MQSTSAVQRPDLYGSAIFDPSAVEKASDVSHERVPLTVLSYADFEKGDADTVAVLKRALLEQGIVGIRGIPGFRDLVQKFIESAVAFSVLDASVKAQYAPDRSKEWLGYELGAEKFQRADGVEVVDDSKASYYALVPDHKDNKWPKEVGLRQPYLEIGALMSKTGQAVMEKIGLLGPDSPIILDNNHVGRMLFYSSNANSQTDNPLWCGEHEDHGVFTGLLPAVYFDRGQQIPEPEEAGLFVRAANDTVFKKVVADDPDVMLFQAAEFGQLALNDKIQATEHRVHKANSSHVSRHTMAFFFRATADCTIKSNSELTSDTRYGGGATCTYGKWDKASQDRYLVKK